MMKFSDMPYARPDLDEVKSAAASLISRMKTAATADECFAVYRDFDEFTNDHWTTVSLARIRHSLDTTDAFYNEEKNYWDAASPQIQELYQAFVLALLESPFRKEMEAEWGSLMFVNAEMELKTFKPEIIPLLQDENALSSQYDKIIAQAQIEFDGKSLTLAQIRPYCENPDRAVRKSATEAIAGWYSTKTAEIDEIFDKLVKIRTQIARELGFDNFIPLGYLRMQRNCYDQDMVARFREGVAGHIVPVVTGLKEAQAARIGVGSIKVYDQSFEYTDGNAMPIGTPDDIFAHGRKMYHVLSPETAEFIDFMMDNGLFDVLTRPGKSAGGYCASLPKYKSPFIFANFNGTAGDIDVFTHEAGHALASYAARDIYPSALQNYTYEIAEIHSMSMEFFTWEWMEGFFGAQTAKYYNSHLTKALAYLPYLSMIDEFQHMVYQNPGATAADRNRYWLELEAKYRPWLDIGDTPYYSEGLHWHSLTHIFRVPFYMIDYCLAQVVALNFWTEHQTCRKSAWDRFMRLISHAGTKTFLDLLESVDMPGPFDPRNIKAVADSALKWLDAHPH
jgi:M3 family oligoendopeptidase